MKRKNEEMQRKSEEEILSLRKENEGMKKKWVEGGPSGGPSNPLGSPLLIPLVVELLRNREQSTPRRLRVSPIRTG